MPHKRKGTMFRDVSKCTHCGAVRRIWRYADSAGRPTRTYCVECSREFVAVAKVPKEAEREKGGE